MAEITTRQIAIGLMAAAGDFDYRHGGFETRALAEFVAAACADRFTLENSGDLWRLYDPVRREYFWPLNSTPATWDAAMFPTVN